MVPPRVVPSRRPWFPLVLLLAGASCGEPDPAGPVTTEIVSECLPIPTWPEGAVLDPGVILAIQGVQEEVRSNPQDPELRFELGMTLDANSLHAAAWTAYEQTTQLDPSHARAHYHGARMLRELGRLEEARAGLGRALELAPDYAPAHRRSGEWLVQGGEFSLAKAAFQRVNALEPNWPDGDLGLAHLALLEEQPQRAEELARGLVNRSGDLAYAHHLLGSALRELGRAEEAESAFARAAGGVPVWQDPWVDEVEAHLGGFSRLMVEAKACLEAGLHEQAHQRLVLLHGQAPDDVTVQGMWTAALTKMSRHAEALEMLQAARKRQPDHFRIELNLAIVRWKQKELDLAVEHLNRAIELNPGHEAIYMVEGQVRRDRGDGAGAIQSFEKALALGEDPGRVLPQIGRLKMSLQDWAGAAKTYGQLAKASPGEAATHATLAGCLLEAGDLEGARAELFKAREIDPEEKLLPMVEARLAELSGRE